MLVLVKQLSAVADACRGISRAGTGKTAMLSITALQLVDTTQREIQVLIMNPTRELANQTQKVILAIGDYMQIQAHSCIGGKSIGDDIRKLDHGVHIVSGTPGRVFDMIRRRNLRTRNIKTLILDEADEMLNQVHFQSLHSSPAICNPTRPPFFPRMQFYTHEYTFSPASLYVFEYMSRIYGILPNLIGLSAFDVFSSRRIFLTHWYKCF